MMLTLQSAKLLVTGKNTEKMMPIIYISWVFYNQMWKFIAALIFRNFPDIFSDNCQQNHPFLQIILISKIQRNKFKKQITQISLKKIRGRAKA